MPDQPFTDELPRALAFQARVDLAAQTADAAAFPGVIADAADALGLPTLQAVARLVHCSPAGIVRYASGELTPAPVRRDLVYSVLRATVARRVAVLRTPATADV